MKVISRELFNKIGSTHKTMQTVCLGCPFSNTQDSSDANVENFCAANKLVPIEKNGGEVYAIKNKDGKYYTAIDKRLCNMMRSDEWKDAKISDGHTDDELIQLARKEAVLRCDFIVYCGPCPEIKNETDEVLKRQKTKNKIHEVAITMKSVDSGIIKPAHIYAINNSGCIGPYDFINYLRRECVSLGIESKWNMEHISHDSVSLMDEESACGASLNVAIKSSRSQYFSFFLSGDVVPENYLHDVDKEINDNMQRILVLCPEKNKKSGLLVQRLCEKQISQSPAAGGFIEKIKKEAEEQKCQSLIRSLSSVVKNML